MKERQPNISELTDVQVQKGNEIIISYLIALLGITRVENDGKHRHYMIVDEYIKESLSDYTYSEIKEAFKMLLRGEYKHLKSFKDFKVFSKLDCVVLAKVIHEGYDVVKKQKLKPYNDLIKKNILILNNKYNEPTNEEKLNTVKFGIVDSYNFYKKNKDVEFGRLYLFDFLDKRNLLNKDVSYRRSVKDKAIKLLRNKKAISKPAKLIMKSIKNKDNTYKVKLLLECQRLALIDFFEERVQKEDIEKITEKITSI